MDQITQMQHIMLDAFHREMKIKRDMGSRGEPEYGQKSKDLNAALIHMEGELLKQIKRLRKGAESIYEILPHLIDEGTYDKEEGV